MRHQQIQAEWKRALKSLQAAETLQVQGLTEDAISRAYYAVMHAAKAALLVHDAVAQRHAAVRRLFGKVLVRGGEIEKEWAEILAREQDPRGAAEYNVDLEIDRGCGQIGPRCAAFRGTHCGLLGVQGSASRKTGLGTSEIAKYLKGLVP